MRPLTIITTTLASSLALATAAQALVFVNQTPVVNGTMRQSQLWQDPGPDGNDLDSDAVTWQDFTISVEKTIDHLEWWGTGACELGFRIEVWPQDPGTIAYQPLGVFYYGNWNPPPVPTVTFDVNAEVVKTPGPGGLTHYSLDLATPFTLPANAGNNPRWFIGVIGLTAQPYALWYWARGTGGSNKSFRWMHGSGGPVFQVMPEGRALVLDDTTEPCAGDINGDLVVDGMDITFLLGQWGTAGSADLNGDGTVNGADITNLLAAWGACP